MTPWRIAEAWLFWSENADRWEDVSTTIDRRAAALLAHASQVGDDRDKLLEHVRSRAREAARTANVAFEYTEAFKVLGYGGSLPAAGGGRRPRARRARVGARAAPPAGGNGR